MLLDRGRFRADLSFVTMVMGTLLCICEVIVAPPCGDASTVMDFVLLLMPSVLSTVLTGDCMMTSATDEASEFATRFATGLPPTASLFTLRGCAVMVEEETV